MLSSRFWHDLIGCVLPEGGKHGGNKQREDCPQVGEDLADIVAAGAQNCEDRIACFPLEGATRQ